MRDVSLSIWCAILTVLLLAAAPAAARTQCNDDVTAACVELAGHVGRYDQLLWAVCDNDGPTVCKCWNAQQQVSGVDWCQWAACACAALSDATLKQGICGLSTACGSITAVKQQRQGVAKLAAPAFAGQVEQVRNGEIVDCSPQACMALGAPCARAAGALEILKDQGKIADATSCSMLAKDPAAFGKRVHVDGLSPAVAACACSAVF
jgi:hypothetical protein